MQGGDPPETMGAGAGCILVVDDSDMIRTMVREILLEGGYEVLEAADGAQAARLYRERSGEILAVVLDAEMPVMGGHETVRVLRSMNPVVRILLMSGRGSAADHERAGVEAFILKPFRMAHLLEQVGRLVAAATRR